MNYPVEIDGRLPALLGRGCKIYFLGNQSCWPRVWQQCLLSLNDQKNKAGQLVCPAMSEVDKDTVALLEKVAARKNFDSSIQLTFACQTELSDQKQLSE